ncbi:MAG: redoxin domain-containing protein, partial [Actinomycetota bacterium]|nr:redoxin domain-containing protein [Actinomycetota bacterium]
GGGQVEGEHDGPADDVSVPEALDFSAVQVSGAAFDARGLAGTDTVFWFWAPWCAECAAAAPDVEAAAAATPDVRFVGVAGLSSDVDAMETFVDDHGLTFTQLADSDGSVFTRFGVAQQDTYVLVSADGDVETVPAYGDSVDLDALMADTFA